MIDNIRQDEIRFDSEIKSILTEGLIKILTEDWGGPKNPMAKSYYRQVIIPDLLNCLELNLHAINSPIFTEILTDKLNTQFGFPPTFASGLAGDIVSLVKEYIPDTVAAAVDQYEPWERLFRMLSIGESSAAIAERTGFSQEYVELIHKRYRQFIKTVTELGPKSFDCFAQTELIEYGEQLLQFMYRFWLRFEDPHYLERLQAEDIVHRLGLQLTPEKLLASLVVIHDFEGQVDRDQLVDLLKFGSSSHGQKLELFTGSWPLKTYSKQDIQYFIEQLLKKGYINSANSGEITLATKSAQLVGALLAPRLVASVLENIVPGNKNLTEARNLLQELNTYVLEKVISRLARTGFPEVVEILQQLPQKQYKRIYLKILWACGEIQSTNALNFVIDAMQHRDAMIRSRACQALGKIGDTSGYFALMRCLDDNIPAVKEQALIAIGRLGLRTALKKIEDIANNLEEDIHVRHVAREVIEQISSKEGPD